MKKKPVYFLFSAIIPILVVCSFIGLNRYRLFNSLPDGVIILEDDINIEIQERGLPFGGQDGSLSTMQQAPEGVRNIHTDFIGSGLHIIKTSSDFIKPDVMGKSTYNVRGRIMLKQAIKIAVDAKMESRNDELLIAGLVPSMCNTYNLITINESESEGLIESCELLINAFAEDNNIDLLLISNIKSSKEAEMMMKLMKNYHKPYIMSVDLANKSRSVVSGESVNLIAGLTKKHKNYLMKGIILKHHDHAILLSAVKSIRGIVPSSIKIGVDVNQLLLDKQQYSQNSNDNLKYSHNNNVISNKNQNQCYKYAPKWKKAGVSIISGCCGINEECVVRMASKV